MKKIFYTLVLFVAVQAVAVAQDTIAVSKDNNPKFTLYFGVGVASTSDYTINENLAQAGMPEIGNVSPEFSFGYNVASEKVSMDFEINASYSDKKTSTTRLKNAMLQTKLRGHYVPYRTKSFFISGGADVSYAMNQFDLYSRDNVYDLDNLNPAVTTGHISLNNGQLFAGPSVALGFFQDKSYAFRLNTGYEWGLTNGKWRSDFGEVSNTVKENGLGRFYAKVVLYLH